MQHLDVQICLKNMNNMNNVPNIFKVNKKDIKTMCGASIVNFEHISHFILLLTLLNLSK